MSAWPEETREGNLITGETDLLIGMTYDLRDDYLSEGYTKMETAEFDRPDTIEAIDQALSSLGFKTDRIGSVKTLTKRLSAGDRWDTVFNIAEGLYGYGREAQVPALLDAYRIPYVFSDPLVLAVTLHKGITKRLIRDFGIATPDFAVVADEKDLDAVRIPYPLFVKPVAEGTSKGIDASSKVTSSVELSDTCRRLLAAYGQPLLVEAFLPGREFTVGIVGTGREAAVLGVLEISLREKAEKDIYSYTNKENYRELVEYRLADGTIAAAAKDIALAAWQGLGCRDGGRVDLRADGNGTLHFLEVNPLAGLHPVHSDLPIICRLAGISYRELIDRIMQSACKRIAAKDQA
jgi:D-alanine-D-alanine ligase